MQNKVAAQARSSAPKPSAQRKSLTSASNHASGFVDARPAAAVQLRLQQMAANSRRGAPVGNVGTTQRVRSDRPLQRDLREGPIQRVPVAEAAPNRTGLPDHLKAGVENLSGLSLDDVRVHYNSPQPAQLQAHAFAQGKDIHVAPGQEAHLPHEAWHVVQQAQGRVKPTLQMKAGIPVNDDAGLEAEADVMGAKAVLSGAGAIASQLAIAKPVRNTGRFLTHSAPIQPKLKVGAIDYTALYMEECKTLPQEKKKAFLETMARDLLQTLLNDEKVKSDPDIKESFAESLLLKAKDETYIMQTQLMKWIEDTPGVPGPKSHSIFGRKNHRKFYDTNLQLAHDLLGWVLAKPNRKKEGGYAEIVYKNVSVAAHMNSLMKKVSVHIEKGLRLPDGTTPLPEDRIKKIQQELRTSVVEGTDALPSRTRFGTYQNAFDEKHPKGDRVKTGIVDRDQLQVLSHPLRFSLKDKIVVLHDLMEYFGGWHVPTHVAGYKLMPEPTSDKQESTTSLTPDKKRDGSAPNRGKLLINDPDSKSDPPAVLTHSTRDHKDPGTKLARSMRIPLWAGQSFTAMRMLGLADWVSANQAEKTALAWAIFAFWRKDYDHTSEYAYHTLHEVMDIAFNFGVEYSMANQKGDLTDHRFFPEVDPSKNSETKSDEEEIMSLDNDESDKIEKEKKKSDETRRTSDELDSLNQHYSALCLLYNRYQSSKQNLGTPLTPDDNRKLTALEAALRPKHLLYDAAHSAGKPSETAAVLSEISSCTMEIFEILERNGVQKKYH